MARGGGSGGRGGMGGSGGRGSRSATRATNRAVRRTERKVVNRTATRSARRAEDKLEEDLDGALGGIHLYGAKDKLNGIRNVIRREMRRASRDSRGRFKKMSQRTNQEIRNKADEIAVDVLRKEAYEINMASLVDEGRTGDFTRNGVYKTLRPGQNALLQQHGMPQIKKGFAAHLPRESILRRARRSHPDIQAAIDQTLIDLVDLGQRIRDGISAAAGGDNN